MGWSHSQANYWCGPPKRTQSPKWLGQTLTISLSVPLCEVHDGTEYIMRDISYSDIVACINDKQEDEDGGELKMVWKE